MIIKGPQKREDILASDPNRVFFVWWDDVLKSDVDSFELALKSANNEHDIHSYLQNNPILLIQHLGGGHGRWVIPKLRLGAEHVTDFIIGHRHSYGFEWQALELESPKARMFTKSGDPTMQLTHAIRQIQDWRAWLQRNQDYAARTRSEHGLGLTDIVAAIPGLILIGRRIDIDPTSNDRRRQMANDLNIQIHSYDFLLSSAGDRMKALGRHRSTHE